MIAFRVRSVSQALESIDEAFFQCHSEAAQYAKAVRGIIDAVVILAPRVTKGLPLRVSSSDTQENL